MNQLSVWHRLLDEGYRFDFFQAVRICELRKQSLRADPQTVHDFYIGSNCSLNEESVRFVNNIEHAFPHYQVKLKSAPPSDSPEDATRPMKMEVSITGLTGPLGTLPRCYTSLIRKSERQHDSTLRDFIDALSHRSISFLYRAWAKYRLPIAYEHAAHSGIEDPLTESLYALVGIQGKPLRSRLGIDDALMLYFSGLFSDHTRPAVALEQIVAHFSGVETNVIQFVGEWLNIPPDQRSLIESEAPGMGQIGVRSVLGENVVVGARVWEMGGRFRVRLGPLSLDEFYKFIPSNTQLRLLCNLIRAFVGPEYDFDVQLLLRAEEIPRASLDPAAKNKPHLGWNTWLLSKPAVNDSDNAIFYDEGLT